MLFVSKMAASWYETYGQHAGEQLAAEAVNLYHATQWLIKPATEGYRARKPFGQIRERSSHGKRV